MIKGDEFIASESFMAHSNRIGMHIVKRSDK